MSEKFSVGQAANDDAQPTPEEIAAGEKAMASMDILVEQWAAEVDLPSMIKNLTHVNRLHPNAPKDVREDFIRRQGEQFEAIARQAFLEGGLRGFYAHKDIMASKIEACLDPELLERAAKIIANETRGAGHQAVARWLKALAKQQRAIKAQIEER